MTNEIKSNIIKENLFLYQNHLTMEGKFDSKAYLEKLQAEISARATQTKGKFYIKINGKLLKDDYASRTLD